MRIHIVDDDPDTVQGLALCFGVGLPEASVTWSSSGRQGLRTVKEDQPDIVLLDIALPDLDGFEVLTELRSAGSDVPLIVLTAKTEDADRDRALGLGADDFIAKPFEYNEILARITSVLERRKSQSR